MHDPSFLALEVRFGKRRVIDVWHDEPGGRDSGEICGYPHGWTLVKHLHHLHMNVLPIGRLRRKYLTRCEWCHGRSRTGDHVNCSLQWDSAKSRWWRGERGLYHANCSGMVVARRQCLCADPLPSQEPFSGNKCLLCGKPRAWRLTDSARFAYRMQATIPLGTRPTPAQDTAIAAAWKVFQDERAAREASA